MASTSNMIIANIGLSKVAQRIIEQRLLNRNDIELVGHPLLVDTGYLSAISQTSYAVLKGLNLTDESISIEGYDNVTFVFKGKYKHVSQEYQTCVTLKNDIDDSRDYRLCLNKNTIKVFLDRQEILSIPGFNFHEDEEISFKLYVCNGIYMFKRFIEGSQIELQGDTNVQSTYFGEGYTSIYAGVDPLDRSKFWYGSIDLANFYLYADGKNYIYTPSFGSGFEFSKILVSDGEIPLTDNSIATYKHIFEFPVQHGHSGAGLLFTTEIDKDTYLTIKEIGLYISIGGKEYLFGTASGFPPLQKTKDVGYNLIFMLKITASVGNCYIFPDIIVRDMNFSKLSDLEKLELIHAFVITDLERAINNNATLIGYEADEVFYQMFNQTKFINANYMGAHQYAKINQNICPKETRVLDMNAIEIVGTLDIDGSLISNFTSSNYAYILTSETLETNWEFQLSFKMPRSFQAQTIACICDSNEEPKLILGTDTSGAVHVRTSTGILKRLFDVENLKKTYVKIKCDGTTITFYKKVEGASGWTKVGEAASTALGEIAHVYLGVSMDSNTVSSPLIGTIDMKDILLVSNGVDCSPSTVTTRYIKLEDFYHFIDYPANFYKIKNLKPMGASSITYIDGSITGGLDSIDFDKPEGSSLAVTINLDNAKDKLIVAKREIGFAQDPETEELVLTHKDYFTLEIKNFTLIATVYTEDSIIELKKAYTPESSNEIVGVPLTIVITAEHDFNETSEGEPEELIEDAPYETVTFKMYINNEKVAEEYCDDPIFPNPYSCKITNYEVEPAEATKNYVSCIADFDGVLTEDEINYLVTLLGTKS